MKKKKTKTIKESPPKRKRGRPKKTRGVKEEVIEEPKKELKRDYIFAVGRRKEAVARVRYFPKEAKEITVNGKKLEEYLPTFSLQKIALAPLETCGIISGKFTIKVQGGGKRGQTDAIKLGIARTLVKLNPELKGKLKRASLLRRDARIKERKKYGLKRARRAPQWQKR